MADKKFTIRVLFQSFESLENVQKYFAEHYRTKNLTVRKRSDMKDQFITTIAAETSNIADAVDLVTTALDGVVVQHQLRILKVDTPVAADQAKLDEMKAPEADPVVSPGTGQSPSLEPGNAESDAEAGAGS